MDISEVIKELRDKQAKLVQDFMNGAGKGYDPFEYGRHVGMNQALTVTLSVIEDHINGKKSGERADTLARSLNRASGKAELT